MLDNILFPLFRPRDEQRPRARATRSEGVSIRWLGTAGFIIETTSTTLVLDPFATRPTAAKVALSSLRPDETAVASLVSGSVDAVVCSHGHYDHLLDAPTLARGKRATFVGSAACCAFARASGVPPANMACVPAGGGKVAVGDARVELVPSRHARIWMGKVPFDGDPPDSPRVPARVWDYRAGDVFGVLVETGGISIYLSASADLVDAALAGRRADVVLVGLAGREVTRDYLGRLLMALQPSVVVPCHHDAFFGPLGQDVRLLPGVDVDGFVAETRMLLPRATIVTPLYREPLVVPTAEPRAAGLLDREPTAGRKKDPERAVG